jgi:hypothetical protein
MAGILPQLMACLSRTASNASPFATSTTALADTPSKVPVLTPSRTIHKTKSLSNLNAENRSPAGAEPMDLSTPYKEQRNSPYRASVSSPVDLRRAMKEKSAPQAEVPQSLALKRPELHHAATTTAIRQPQARPAAKTSQSFSFRELGTPAKWSPDDPDAPSPFIKREPQRLLPKPVATDALPPLRGNLTRRAGSTKPSDLYRKVVTTNLSRRLSAEGLMAECPSPLRSRAALAQQDALRAMGG